MEYVNTPRRREFQDSLARRRAAQAVEIQAIYNEILEFNQAVIMIENQTQDTLREIKEIAEMDEFIATSKYDKEALKRKVQLEAKARDGVELSVHSMNILEQKINSTKQYIGQFSGPMLEAYRRAEEDLKMLKSIVAGINQRLRYRWCNGSICNVQGRSLRKNKRKYFPKYRASCKKRNMKWKSSSKKCVIRK
jgi:hypothetical protein